MYSDLWINNPKESLEFPDYTYEQHFGKLLPSYAPRAAIRDYLEGMVEFWLNFMFSVVDCMLTLCFTTPNSFLRGWANVSVYNF